MNNLILLSLLGKDIDVVRFSIAALIVFLLSFLVVFLITSIIKLIANGSKKEKEVVKVKKTKEPRKKRKQIPSEEIEEEWVEEEIVEEAPAGEDVMEDLVDEDFDDVVEEAEEEFIEEELDLEDVFEDEVEEEVVEEEIVEEYDDEAEVEEHEEDEVIDFGQEDVLLDFEPNPGFVTYLEEFDIHVAYNMMTDWQKENMVKLIHKDLIEYQDEPEARQYCELIASILPFFEQAPSWNRSELQNLNFHGIAAANTLVNSEIEELLNEGDYQDLGLWLHTMDALNSGFENDDQGRLKGNAKLELYEEMTDFDKGVAFLIKESIEEFLLYYDDGKETIQKMSQAPVFVRDITRSEVEDLASEVLSGTISIYSLGDDYQDLLIRIVANGLISRTKNSIENISVGMPNDIRDRIRSLAAIVERMPYSDFLADISVAVEVE